MTDANSHVTTTIDDANGQAVGGIDANGNLKQTAYDSIGEVVGMIDGDGNYTGEQYDAQGHLVAYTDPVGNQTRYYYDRDGREILRTDPTGAATTTAYDSDGNKTSVTDRDGRQTTFAYDADNRLTVEKWYNSSGTLINTQTFAYDNVGNLTSAADTNGTVTRAYDELNRVTSQTDVFGNTTTYNYDNADRLTQMTDSKGGTTTYQYDNGRRLTSVQFGGSGQTQARIDLGYDNRDELTSQTRYADVNGTMARGSTAYAYDDGGRVTAITNTNGSGATLSYYNYNYDSGNRVTQETWQSTTSTTTLSGTHTYGYDNADQLTSADSSNYSYDANGNRNSAGYTTGSANRMTNDGTYTYGYDAEGNLTSKVAGGASPDTWAFTYNQNNQLVSVTEKSDGTNVNFSVTYTYDAMGQRVQQDRWTSGTGLVTTRLDYDISGRVWAQTDGSNNVQARDLWGNGQTQLLAEINVGAGTRTFALADRLGSIRDVANGSVAYVSDHVEFGAFGTVATESNATAGINNLYTGLWQDRVSGIVFAEHRTLLTVTGRWMEEDPIAFDAGDSNLYRYGFNDATNMSDSTGDVAESEPIRGNTEGKWEIVQKNVSDLAAGYESFVTLTFLPNDNSVDSTEIAFIQICRIVYDDGTVATGKELLDKQEFRQGGDGWSVDRQPKKYAWLGYDDRGKPEAAYTVKVRTKRIITPVVPGKSSRTGTTPAVLQDVPGDEAKLGAPRVKLTFEFETYAVAKAGKEKGKVYGGVYWGFHVDGLARMTSLKRRFLDPPTPEFRRSVMLWNAQANGPKAQRTVPDQEPLQLLFHWPKTQASGLTFRALLLETVP
jgi:RHS repeat-associated protein